MTQLREEIDADLRPGPVHFADLKSDEYSHEVLCSMCGTTFYADDAGYERYLRSIRYDPDNQFVCDRCDREIDEMAHGAG